MRAGGVCETSVFGSPIEVVALCGVGVRYWGGVSSLLVDRDAVYLLDGQANHGDAELGAL